MENREIKFRAFERNTHEFRYGFFTKDYHGISFIATLNGQDTYYVEMGTLGQFTGLKDKSGIEIYEGDILRCPFSKYGASKNNKYQDFILPVVYCEDSFIMQVGKVKLGHYRCYPSWDECEVIGNIHQNPELL